MNVVAYITIAIGLCMIGGMIFFRNEKAIKNPVLSYQVL
jgi:hypothetical protein